MSKSPDIVARLRYGTQQRNHGSLIELCTKAADEIERLRKDVLDLRYMHHGYRNEIIEHFREIERLRRIMINWKIDASASTKDK